MSKAPTGRTILLVLSVSITALVVGEMVKSRYVDTPMDDNRQPQMVTEIVTPRPFEKAEMAVGNKLEGPYPFFDQNGQQFELSDWFDKTLVISYIFTECPMVCPTISASLADFVRSGFKTLGKDFRIVSVGFDAANDKPAAMLAFGEKFTSDFSAWSFVSGSPQVAKRLSDDIGIAYEPDEQGSWRHTMGVTILAPGGVVSSQLFGMTFNLDELTEGIEKASAKGGKG
ncbi:MAG: SCO family protein [Nitrospinota bacterium]|nr:SCO family protein [Nitrospinota bacterium]